MPPLTVLDGLRAYLLDRPGASEDTPFGPDALVYRVGNKMFALVMFKSVPLRCNLKCDPLRALELRDEFAAVLPGYHMNKRHWNTVILDGSIPEAVVCALIDHSYALVRQGLSRTERAALEDAAPARGVTGDTPEPSAP